MREESIKSLIVIAAIIIGSLTLFFATYFDREIIKVLRLLILFLLTAGFILYVAKEQSQLTVGFYVCAFLLYIFACLFINLPSTKEFDFQRDGQLIYDGLYQIGGGILIAILMSVGIYRKVT